MSPTKTVVLVEVVIVVQPFKMVVLVAVLVVAVVHTTIYQEIPLIK
jgi:hypothetical protein